MKKALMLLMFGIMVLGVKLAKASDRTDAMSADINVVEDYDLIFTYPNKVVDYKNTVDFRMGYLNHATGTSDDWGGILDGKQESVGVLGVYLHRPDVDDFMGTSYNNMAYNGVLNNLLNYWGDTYHGVGYSMLNYIASPVPVFDIFWGKGFGDTSLGLKLSYADSKDNENETYNEASLGYSNGTEDYVDYSRQFGIQAGVGVKNLGPFQEADLAAGYVLGKVEYSSTYTDTVLPVEALTSDSSIKDDGISSINVNVNLRHDLGTNDNLKVFANAKIEQFALTGTDNGYATDTEYVGTLKEKDQDNQINIGLGLNHSVNEGDGLVSAGIKAQMISAKETASYMAQGDPTTPGGYDVVSQAILNGDWVVTEEKMSYLAVPVFMSVEAKVKSWLTLRAGMSYYLYSKEHDTETETFGSYDYYYTNNDNITFNTGFGLNWKNWTLDAVLNTNDLEDNIRHIQPGRGLLFTGDLATVTTASLKYKF